VRFLGSPVGFVVFVYQDVPSPWAGASSADTTPSCSADGAQHVLPRSVVWITPTYLWRQEAGNVGDQYRSNATLVKEIDRMKKCQADGFEELATKIAA
jgi:hypothetical protein